MGGKPQIPVTACECGDHVFKVLCGRYVALTDPEDRELLEKPWTCIQRRGSSGAVSVVGYDKRNHKSLVLARVILGVEGTLQADHENVNPLDNRRRNLRAATPTQNLANRRRYTTTGLPKGVWRRENGRFSAMVNYRGQRRYLGTFDSASEAHEAYREAALEVFGAFARFD